MCVSFPKECVPFTGQCGKEETGYFVGTVSRILEVNKSVALLIPSDPENNQYYKYHFYHPQALCSSFVVYFIIFLLISAFTAFYKTYILFWARGMENGFI